MTQWVVGASESGLKLQQFLRKQLSNEISARQIKHAIDKGCCQVNGRIERFGSCLVGTGDRISFDIPEELYSPQLKIAAMPIDDPARCLYEDKDLFVYNKAAGISSDDKNLLIIISKQSSSPFAELVHRLDRDTTGVLIFAKNRPAAEAMLSLFKQRKVKKTYLALVDGILKSPSGVVENYLGKLSSYQGQTLWGEVPKEKGVPARTSWEVKNTGKEASFVVCYPETGRTHQIRVHMSGLGHPILGDVQYGRTFRCRYRPGRLMLHAVEVTFEHPVIKKMITIAAPLPDDFAEALEAIGCTYE